MLCGLASDGTDSVKGCSKQATNEKKEKSRRAFKDGEEDGPNRTDVLVIYKLVKSALSGDVSLVESL